MVWRIEFSDAALKALRKIEPKAARRIAGFLRQRVAPSPNPRSLGKALRGEWRTYWRYRVGSYRVICHIQDDALRVLVIRVRHRKDVY